MKKRLLLLSILIAHSMAYAIMNPGPCLNNVQFIQCGTIVTVTTSFNQPDPDFPNGMYGQGCSLDTNQGGPAKIFKFIVPANGTYQFNVTLVLGAINNFEYYYKPSSICDNTGWNCIGITDTAASLEAFNWVAGDTVLLLIKAEQNILSAQKFTILCATEVCNSILPVNCNDTVSINFFGFGNPNYPNQLNAQGCGSGTAQGGKEIVYQFIPASSTACNYQINAFNGQGGNQIVSYYYKDSSGICDHTDWKCLGQTAANGMVTLGTFSWTSNDTILLLLNAQQTNTTLQQFSIDSSGCLSTTGVQSVYLINKIKIIPNPSKSQFKIELPPSGNNYTTLIITDVWGHKVLEHKINHQPYIEVDLPLATGIYILNINSTDFNYRAKLVLEQ